MTYKDSYIHAAERERRLSPRVIGRAMGKRAELIGQGRDMNRLNSYLTK